MAELVYGRQVTSLPRLASNETAISIQLARTRDRYQNGLATPPRSVLPE
jgi:hypothetical protein